MIYPKQIAYVVQAASFLTPVVVEWVATELKRTTGMWAPFACERGIAATVKAAAETIRSEHRRRTDFLSVILILAFQIWSASLFFQFDKTSDLEAIIVGTNETHKIDWLRAANVSQALNPARRLSSDPGNGVARLLNGIYQDRNTNSYGTLVTKFDDSGRVECYNTTVAKVPLEIHCTDEASQITVQVRLPNGNHQNGSHKMSIHHLSSGGTRLSTLYSRPGGMQPNARFYSRHDFARKTLRSMGRFGSLWHQTRQLSRRYTTPDVKHNSSSWDVYVMGSSLGKSGVIWETMSTFGATIRGKSMSGRLDTHDYCVLNAHDSLDGYGFESVVQFCMTFGPQLRNDVSAAEVFIQEHNGSFFIETIDGILTHDVNGGNAEQIAFDITRTIFSDTISVSTERLETKPSAQRQSLYIPVFEAFYDYGTQAGYTRGDVELGREVVRDALEGNKFLRRLIVSSEVDGVKLLQYSARESIYRTGSSPMYVLAVSIILIATACYRLASIHRFWKTSLAQTIFQSMVQAGRGSALTNISNASFWKSLASVDSIFKQSIYMEGSTQMDHVSICFNGDVPMLMPGTEIKRLAKNSGLPWHLSDSDMGESIAEVNSLMSDGDFRGREKPHLKTDMEARTKTNEYRREESDTNYWQDRPQCPLQKPEVTMPNRTLSPSRVVGRWIFIPDEVGKLKTSRPGPSPAHLAWNEGKGDRTPASA